MTIYNTHMKKLIYGAFASMSLLFAASCQPEALEPQGGKETVTYTIQVPGAAATKAAIGSAENVNELIYEVWIVTEKDNLEEGATKLYQETATITNGTAKVSLDLVNNQKYNILFWAQDGNADAYNTSELTDVTYARTLSKDDPKYLSNDESLAAFYAMDFVTAGSPDKTVRLYRPFAQLNIGTVEPSIEYEVKMNSSSVTLSSVPTRFNVASGEVTGHSEMTFATNDLPSDPTYFEVEVEGVKTRYSYVAMNYIFADVNTNVTYTIDATLKNKTTGETTDVKMENTIDSVPVEENFRTNIIGNLLTSKTDYNIIVDESWADNDQMNNVFVTDVTSSESLEEALRRTEENIVINLVGGEVKSRSVSAPVEYFVNVGASQEKYFFGAENTKTITINANGNSINFVHNNGDWNYIRCKSDVAKWIINDAVLTNSGRNDGPFNRHDISFYNAVELNNVISDKAIALYSDAKFSHVKISDVHPKGSQAYALWIKPYGQTVELDHVDIKSHSSKTKDLGIIINQQYVDNPQKVTLNVSNSTFETQSEAAVLVQSAAGAVINWGKGNDISKVKGDSFHAVWVHDATVSLGDVTVSGALVTEYGNTAIEDGAEILLPAGEVNLPAINSDNVVLIGSEEGTELNVGGVAVTGDNVVLKNLNIVNDGKNKTPVSLSGKNPVIENCTFTGAAGNGYGIVVSGNGNGADNVITLRNCDFSGDDFFKPVFDGWNGLGGGTLLIEGSNLSNGLYAMHIDANGQGGKIIVRDSYLAGFITNGASLDNVTFERCTFGEVAGYACVNVYTSHTFIDCVFPTKADANNVGNYGLYISSKAAGDVMTMKNCRMSDGTALTAANCDVADGGFIHWDSDAEACKWNWLGTVTVDSADSGQAMADINSALEAGNDVVLGTDIEAAPVVTAPYGNKVGVVVPSGTTFDGNGQTVSVTGGGDNYAMMTSGGVIKNLTIDCGFRGVVIMYPKTDIYLENIVSAGRGVAYALNTGEGDGTKTLYATDCTFKGWCSWSLLKSANFTGCTFGQGTYYGADSVYGRLIKPYVDTVFDGCEFESGIYLDLSSLASGQTVVIRNCTVDGAKVTRETFTDVVYGEDVVAGKLMYENPTSSDAWTNQVIFE